MENRNRVMKCNETRHYKMYKAGKKILYASISMIAMGSWMFLSQDAHATTASAAQVASMNVTSDTDSSQGTDNNAGNTVSGKQADGTQTPDTKGQVLGNSQTSQTQVKTPQADSQNDDNDSTPVKTIDQLNGQYIDDKGNVSENKPSVATGGSQAAATDADMPTSVTDNFTGQGGQNDPITKKVVIAKPGDNQDNYGQIVKDSNNKQWVKLVHDNNSVAASYSFKNQIDTTSAFDIQGEWYMSKDNPGGGIGVILQPVNPQIAGIGPNSDASIDIGIQGQPNTTFLGFDGFVSPFPDDHDTQPGTLTIRQTDDHTTSKPANGGGFNELNLDTDQSVHAQYTQGTQQVPMRDWWGQYYQDQSVDYRDSPYATVGLRQLTKDQEYDEGPLLDVLFDVNWVPNGNEVDSDNKVSGTLSVTAYSAGDTKMSSPLGKIVTDNTKLPEATSIALFGAFGGSGAGATAQARINSYSLQKVPQTVMVNYVDNDTGELIASEPSTQINASVGNTLEVDETTSGTSASYGAPVIPGYTFLGAVGTDHLGNYQKDTMEVVNTQMLANSAVGHYNTINVYYTKKPLVTRTIEAYTVPETANSTAQEVPQVIGSSVGDVDAVVPEIGASVSGTTQIKDKNGDPIPLSAGLQAVKIRQVDGYTSGYSIKGGADWIAATQIPPITGKDSNTYIVQYAANQITEKFVDENGHSIIPDETITGLANGPISIKPAAIAGYTYNNIYPATNTENPSQLTVASLDGKNVITLHYNANTVTSDVVIPSNMGGQKVTDITGKTGQTVSINVPTISGYNSDKTTVNGTVNANGTITVNTPDFKTGDAGYVTYTGTPNSLTVTYLDDENNQKAIGNPVIIDGITGDTGTYTVVVPKNYKLANGQPSSVKYTITPDDSAKLNIHLAHQHTNNLPKGFNGKTTQTIVYTGVPDGKKQPADVQTIKWSTDTDEVTGTTTYTPNGDYKAVTSPEVVGYTPSTATVSVGGVQATTTEPSNSAVTVTYTADKADLTVTYVDTDENNATIGIPETLNGTTDETGTYTVKVPANYIVASGQDVSVPYTFKAGNDTSDNLQINLVHEHTAELPDGFSGETTRTVTINDPKSGTPTVTQQSVTWTTDTDLVTNTTTYKPSGNYAEILVPTVTGYTPSLATIQEQNNSKTSTRPSNPTKIDVNYTANKNSLQVLYVDTDKNDQLVGQPTEINGVTDQNGIYTVQVPANYILAEGQKNTVNYKITADSSDDLTVRLAHQHATDLPQGFSGKTKRTFMYTGVPDSEKPTTPAQTVTWSTDTDKVTGITTYTPSGNYATTTVPNVAGYIPDKSSIPVGTNSVTTTRPTNTDVSVKYTAIDSDLTVTYIDTDNNNQQAGTSDKITGKTDTVGTYTAKIPTNYVLATGQTSTVGYTVKADDSDNIVIKLAHKHTNDLPTGFTGKTTQTVAYTGVANGKEPKTNIQTVNWSTDKDEVTGTTTYTPSGDYMVVTSPEVAGYTPSTTAVPGSGLKGKSITTEPSDRAITITYTANKANLTVTYVDTDENNVVVGTPETLNGTTDETGTYTVKVPANYIVATGQGATVPYTFKAGNDTSDNLMIKLAHKHDTNLPADFSGKTTQTVVYTGVANGKEPKTNIQTLNWSTDTDEVTGETTYTLNGDYPEVSSPAVAGYTPNAVTVPASAAKVTTTKPIDSTVTVTYIANKADLTVTYVDTDESNVVVGTPETLNGITDETETYTVEVPANYILAKDQGTTIPYTFKAGNDTSDNLTIKLAHKHDINLPADFNGTTTRTITYTGVPLNENLTATVQTVTWATDKDEVTGITTYTPSGDYLAVTVPNVPGYTANQTVVPVAMNGVLSNKPTNVTVSITYSVKDISLTENVPSANQYTINFTDYNGKVVGNTTFDGNAGDNYNFKNNLPKGYVLTPGQTSTFVSVSKGQNPKTPLTVNVTTPAGQDTDGIKVGIKEQFITDDVPSANEYTINFADYNNKVVGTTTFDGNAGDNYDFQAKLPEGYVLTPGQTSTVVSVPKGQDPKTPLIVNVTTPAGQDTDGIEVGTREQVADDVPSANQYTINFTDYNGKVVGNTTFDGNAGDNYNFKNNLPKGYVLTPGQTSTTVSVAKDQDPKTPLIVNVTTPAGITADGIEIGTIEQVANNDVPSANQYTVNFIDYNGEVVGSTKVIGDPGNNFDMTSKLPAGYVATPGEKNWATIPTDAKSDQPITYNVTTPAGSDADGMKFIGEVLPDSLFVTRSDYYDNTQSGQPAGSGLSNVNTPAATNDGSDLASATTPISTDKDSTISSKPKHTTDVSHLKSDSRKDGRTSHDSMGDNKVINHSNNGSSINSKTNSSVDSSTGAVTSTETTSSKSASAAQSGTTLQSQGSTAQNQLPKNKTQTNNKLPQTNDQHTEVASLLGAELLLSSLGLYGLKRKKRHN